MTGQSANDGEMIRHITSIAPFYTEIFRDTTPSGAFLNVFRDTMSRSGGLTVLCAVFSSTATATSARSIGKVRNAEGITFTGTMGYNGRGFLVFG